MPTPPPTFASPDVVRTFTRELEQFATELAVQPPAMRFFALRLFVVVLLRGLEDDDERQAVRAMYRDAAARAQARARRSLAKWGALECDTCGWPLDVDDAARGVCRPCRRRLRAITGSPLETG